MLLSFHAVILYICDFALVYRSLGYMDVVAAAAEASMMLAINEIKELPEYAEKGEVIVCVL